MSNTTITAKQFLENIQTNCSQITHLCVEHIFQKLYEDLNETINEKNIFINQVKNYPQLMRYLNDYAGTIYRKHNSSIDQVYTELADFYGFTLDNEYTIEHTIKKLEKQSPALIMSLTDDDIQIQTIENFEEKLLNITSCNFYKNNTDKFEEKISKLQKNIDLVKRTLQL